VLDTIVLISAFVTICALLAAIANIFISIIRPIAAPSASGQLQSQKKKPEGFWGSIRQFFVAVWEWIKTAFKWFSRLWWLLFVLIYIPTCLTNLFILFTDEGLPGLVDPNKEAHALFIDKMWTVVMQHPQSAIPALIIVTILIILGSRAGRRRN
jgi:hypothetical protein